MSSNEASYVTVVAMGDRLCSNMR